MARLAGATPHRDRVAGGWRFPAWLALAGYLLSIGIVFRQVIASGFDLGFGDRIDVPIEISILEHWRATLMGSATWNLPLYFHPYTDTLGYNDGYLLSGLLYSGWRLGFGPFLSATLTAFTFKTIDYAATLWLVRGVLRWEWGVAVLIATLATISNNMVAQSGHAQINSLALLPVLASLAVLAVRAEIAGARLRAATLAVLAALLLGLWLVTAFYFAWFSLYFALVLGASWLWLTERWRPAALAALLRTHFQTAAVFIGTFAVAAIPFLLVYVPKRLETGGHGYMISYLVQPTDLVNVGEDNLVWGWLVRAFAAVVHLVAEPGSRLERSLLGGEHESGYPVLLFVLVGTAAYALLRRRGDASFARVFALAVVVSWALTLRIWQVSPWIVVHYLVPAASGLRVVLRYQLFVVLPVLLLVGTVYRARFAMLWRQRPWLAALLVAFLIAEQVNLKDAARLSRSEERAAYDAIPAPPAGCAVFYVVAGHLSQRPYPIAFMDDLYPHNVDAMFLAARWRIPTINGYSTFNPPDWNFAHAEAPDYDARVQAYARAHGLRGLCRLDVRDAVPWRRV
ncbi:hypothetical protein ACG3SL_03775 [Sphingomonas sp. CJ20]